MRFTLTPGVAFVVLACGGGGGDDGGTQPPPPVSTVSINQTGSQSIVVGGTVALSATARDAQGNALSGRTITWSSTNTNAVTVSPVTGTATTATGVGVGSAEITASSEQKQSSPIEISVTSSTGFDVASVVAGSSSDTFTPQEVTVRVPAKVTWQFGSRVHNVTFRDAAPAEGDIGNSSNRSVTRTFQASGTYDYDCTIHPGMSGTVQVNP